MADHAACLAIRERSNGRVLLLCGGIVLGMGGLTAAAVPLYDLFCRVTGYGGTTGVADASESFEAGARTFTIRFNADTEQGLPWQFEPLQRTMTVQEGGRYLAFYRATNMSDEPVIGTATFNVTPMKTGQYFDKIACFCFEEQLLAPGESMDMPVSFRIHPAISEDDDADDVTTITLSYTFFHALDAAPQVAETNQ